MSGESINAARQQQPSRRSPPGLRRWERARNTNLTHVQQVGVQQSRTSVTGSRCGAGVVASRCRAPRWSKGTDPRRATGRGGVSRRPAGGQKATERSRGAQRLASRATERHRNSHQRTRHCPSTDTQWVDRDHTGARVSPRGGAPATKRLPLFARTGPAAAAANRLPRPEPLCVVERAVRQEAETSQLAIFFRREIRLDNQLLPHV